MEAIFLRDLHMINAKLKSISTSLSQILALLAVASLLPGTVFGKETILVSPHNLSATAKASPGGGYGKSKVAFSEELRVCIFCHVPHNAKEMTPLWGHDLPALSYDPYDSSTLHEKPDAAWVPTGASRLCLSCHDGTIAISSYKDSPIINFPQSMPGRANLGTNLSNDHPISFSYLNAAVATAELTPIGSLPAAIRLEWGDYMQCNTCHDPHNNEFGNFLVMANSGPANPGSPLCITCHKNSGWESSTHNPLLTASLAPGCMNCHTVHAAPGTARLLTAVKESDTCYVNCHKGGATLGANVQPLFGPTYFRHPVADVFTPPHDEGQEKTLLPVTGRHVECVDCHNPHQANRDGVPVSIFSPPAVTGRLKGVSGIDMNRVIVPAVNEYEVCFKCHSGANASAFHGSDRPVRINNDPSSDLIGRFDATNGSYHPVTTTRPAGSGASLLNPSMQADMRQIYCSDCHNSDQSPQALGTGPAGPHGSRWPHILKAQYDMPPRTLPGPTFSIGGSYDLCFRCHLEAYVMTGASSGFRNGLTNEHDTHVNLRKIPCFACHDPHGVPVAPNSHLVNFEEGYARDAVVPNPVYVPTVTGGSCTVRCHAVAGNIETYSR
jgi:predicted CXXCH cytochrome family protein